MRLPRRDFLAASTSVAALGARPALAADKEIVIACSLPLSGPAAPTGITTQRTVEHCCELISQEGIIIGGDRYKLTPKFYDNKYIPAEAVSVVEKVLADGVKYLFVTGSGNSVPVVGKTTEAKVLQLSGASGKEHLTAPRFPLSFRVQPTNETAYAVYPWLKTAFPGVKKVAHMDPSDEAGFTEAEDRTMIAAKNGLTNIGKEFFKRGSTDMYPVATRLVGMNPDIIDFGGTIGRDQGLAVKALRELGYKGQILLGYSDARSFVEIAGADAAEGTIMFDTLVEGKTPEQTAVVDWWVGKYGQPFPSYVFLMWDWPFIFADAIRKAQSIDTEKVAEALRTTVHKGVLGEERFGMKSVYGIDCSLTRQIPMSVIKGGKPVWLATIDWPAGV
jgi:branched-chain amino acid transport system substrate-binding protein